MLINLARLGKSGTGMWQYSTRFVECLSHAGLLKGIICEKSHRAEFSKYNCELILTPEWVSNTARVSKVRPVLWLLYSYYLAFKLKSLHPKNQVISTTHHALPLLTNQVITIHDLRPYHFPDSFLQRFYFQKILPRATRRCIKIITVSETVRAQISKTMSYNNHDIHVIPNAISALEFQSIPKERSEPYFLAVGASWEHKNIHNFIIHHDVWVNHGKLKIVCGKTDYLEKLKELIATQQITDKVEFLHDVSFGELKSLYANAIALIYPSKDEGFGIPPIEAMATGTPAIVSDIPVFHEVLGESAIYVNPESHESWESALSILFKKRVEYIERGLELSSHYSIENMLEAVKKAFHAPPACLSVKLKQPSE